MCLGVPGQLVEPIALQTDLAVVEISGVRRKINLGLLSEDDSVECGDWVLIHVGFALSKIDEQEARATLEFLAGMGKDYEDELAALMESRIE